MNYEGFMVLHDILKQGIQENITNNNNRTDFSPSSINQSYSFYIPNGEISTEICLATALRYFAGGSYLDISISHGINRHLQICLGCRAHSQYVYIITILISNNFRRM